jgi:hypothetical protein
MLGNLKLKYHQMFLKYNLKLYDGCLDEGLKQEIFNKIDSHQVVISSINSVKCRPIEKVCKTQENGL